MTIKMSNQIQRIFDQMGASMPLEIGHDRRASGYRSTINASPIPPLNKVTTPIPPPTTGYSLDDVLTRSAIPQFTPETTEYRPLITSMPVVPGTQIVEQPALSTTTTRQSPEEKPPEELTPEPEEPGCEGPQGLCPPELNQILYRILTTEVDPQMSCPGERDMLYRRGDPSEADYSYKADCEFVYREADNLEFTTSSKVKLRYSSWGPPPCQNEIPPVRLLLLHDALDTRKSWWCCQKLLSPFIDTLSIDLLGSGDSTKLRGLNIKQSSAPSKTKIADGANDDTDEFGTEGMTEVFPWSFEFHAQYLIEMIRVLWPTEKVYVAGVGWGAQIAATMASLSDDIAGIIMINPPSLTRSAHPESAYLGIYHLARIPSDALLESSHVSISHLIREIISRNLKNSTNRIPLNAILDHYSSLDSKRVLIDQIVSIANFKYQELPRTDENTYGLQVENIKASVLVVRSRDDEIYPVDTSNLYPVVYYHAPVQVREIEHCGHFVQLDCPERLSEIIIDFIRQNVGVGALRSIFFGFGSVAQSNEENMLTEFNDLYEV